MAMNESVGGSTSHCRQTTIMRRRVKQHVVIAVFLLVVLGEAVATTASHSSLIIRQRPIEVSDIYLERVRKRQEQRSNVWNRSVSSSMVSVSHGGSLETQPPAGSGSIGTLARLQPYVTRQNAGLALLTVILGAVTFRYRHILLDKERMQDETLRLLYQLRPVLSDDATLSQRRIATAKAYSLYLLGMACWELLGLSTIPVETAAGMVFGWPIVGISLLGKLLGATVSFGLGRGVLAKWASDKLSNQPTFQTVLQSSQAVHGPWTTAFLMKYSVLPEMIKNFGSALLTQITLPMFVTATVIHGGSFTCLWTWWGVETARRLETARLHPDFIYRIPTSLRVTLVTAMIVGVVVSPALMAWWIRDMHDYQSKSKTKHANGPYTDTASTG